MKKSLYLGFALLVAVDTLCQVGFKLAANNTGEASMDLAWLQRIAAEPLLYAVIGGYVVAFFTYMTLLKVAAVGPAFAASHLEIVTVLIISVLFFGEHLTLLQGLGCLTILAGVVVLGLTETEV